MSFPDRRPNRSFGHADWLADHSTRNEHRAGGPSRVDGASQPGVPEPHTNLIPNRQGFLKLVIQQVVDRNRAQRPLTPDPQRLRSGIDRHFSGAASSEVGHRRPRTSKSWIHRTHDPDDDRTRSLHHGVASPEECVIRGPKANRSQPQRLVVASIDRFAILCSKVHDNTSEPFGQAAPMARKGAAVEVGMKTLGYRWKSDMMWFPFRQRLRHMRSKRP